jgi:hypothetical protein
MARLFIYVLYINIEYFFKKTLIYRLRIYALGGIIVTPDTIISYSEKTVHICANCSYHKVKIQTNQNISEEDVQTYRHIWNNHINAENALNPNCIPSYISKNDMICHFKLAIQRKMQSDILIKAWWENMTIKYKLPAFCIYDANEHYFYICVDNNNNTLLNK